MWTAIRAKNPNLEGSSGKKPSNTDMDKSALGQKTHRFRRKKVSTESGGKPIKEIRAEYPLFITLRRTIESIYK